MRNILVSAVVAAVLCNVSAAAQSDSRKDSELSIPVTPPAQRQPMPEESVPPEERLAFLEQYVAGSALRTDRRAAIYRAQDLARRSGDQTAIAAWDARKRDFVEREADLVRRGPALPEPAAPCDRGGDNLAAGLPGCLPFDPSRLTIIYDVAESYDLLAESARYAGNAPEELKMRERASLFRGGPAPHGSYWTELSALAAERGDDAMARRVCGYLRASQYGEGFVTRCEAYAALRAQRWSDWLVLAGNGPGARSLEEQVFFCVAQAHAGAKRDARRACDGARDAVAANTRHLSLAADYAKLSPAHGRALAMTYTHGASSDDRDRIDHMLADHAALEAKAGRPLSLAEGVLQFWTEDKGKLETVIAACRNGNGASSRACALPGPVRGMDVTFRSVAPALRDFLR